MMASQTIRGPTSRLSVGVSCENLADRDLTSKSDPQCVLFIQQPSGQWDELGRTEVLENTLNPKWQTRFVIDFHFEARQNVRFLIIDSDGKARKLKKHDGLGSLELPLAKIASAPGRVHTETLTGTKAKNGRITITCEEHSYNKDIAHIQLAAQKLTKKDTFGKSDPFVEIKKFVSEGHYMLVYRTEMIKNNLNPTWTEFKLPVRDLLLGEQSCPIKLDVFDWDGSDKHELIGSATLTLNELINANAENTQIPLIDPKKVGKKKYQNSGTLQVKKCHIETVVSFLDYIQGGTAMNFSVAIDFTASNGNPQDPRSLHHMSPQGQTQYTMAIQAIGNVIQDYDQDRQYPALGFGAKVPPHGQISHEFFLNLNPDNPFCDGIGGILQAYARSLQNVELYGPTNFAPVINHVARFAAAYQDGRQYFVLLILTDGIVTDLNETKAAIVAASHLPLSIIIAGVGQEDFSAMKELDADQVRLEHNGQAVFRDIVQFVEFRRFLNKDGILNQPELAKAVLEEIPNQVVQWMTAKGIRPLRRWMVKERSSTAIFVLERNSSKHMLWLKYFRLINITRT